MSEKLTFSAFDPMRSDAPLYCHLCLSKPPVFHYEFCLDEGARQSPKSGFCCITCAMRFLEELERVESQLWAEEEASLRVDDIDASDLEERRLATFGSGQQDQEASVTGAGGAV